MSDEALTCGTAGARRRGSFGSWPTWRFVCVFVWCCFSAGSVRKLRRQGSQVNPWIVSFSFLFLLEADDDAGDDLDLFFAAVLPSSRMAASGCSAVSAAAAGAADSFSFLLEAARQDVELRFAALLPWSRMTGVVSAAARGAAAAGVVDSIWMSRWRLEKTKIWMYVKAWLKGGRGFKAGTDGFNREGTSHTYKWK
jgi:hypothetical protein